MARKIRTRSRAPRGRRVEPTAVTDFVNEILAEDMHAKRVLSVSNAVTGLLHSASLAIAAIGSGLASARGLAAKHSIKQVDRLLSNKRLGLEDFFALWVPWILAERDEVLVNLDWTDFDDCDQTMCVLGTQTRQGRSTPLVWSTVLKSELKGCRNDIEDELLLLFRRLVPETVRVTVVADRGFSDTKLYDFLGELDFDFIVRFRRVVHVGYRGSTKPAHEWLSPSGRLRTLKDATVTSKKAAVAAVVMVRDKGMKEGWFLATSRSDLTGRAVVKAYGKRFTCEETFRDVKDRRYGMGMRQVAIKDCNRRDRLMLVAVLAHAFLSILGQAGEDAGLDRLLKVNTSKRRQHSLFRQGLMWYDQIPRMPEERLRVLMTHFDRLLRHIRIASETLGIL